MIVKTCFNFITENAIELENDIIKTVSECILNKRILIHIFLTRGAKLLTSKQDREILSNSFLLN